MGRLERGFDDRMTAARDVERSACIDLRSDMAPLTCQLGQRSRNVEHGERGCDAV